MGSGCAVDVIFTVEQARLIRRGELALAILPDSHQSAIRVGALRKLRREVFDEDGVRSVQTVTEPKLDGERVPVVLTILAVTPETPLDKLTLAQAKAAGYRTTTSLLHAWRAQHPRSSGIVTLVSFALGDQRDAPRLLVMGTRRSDYTEIPALSDIHEPEAISDADLTRLAKFSAAKAHARSRMPLATHPQNMARELDELRHNLTENGVSDRSLDKLMRDAERIHQRLHERLTKAA